MTSSRRALINDKSQNDFLVKPIVTLLFVVGALGSKRGKEGQKRVASALLLGAQGGLICVFIIKRFAKSLTYLSKVY